MLVVPGSEHRGLEELDLAGIRIQPGSNAEGQSPLCLDMADGEAVGHRNAERFEIGREHLIQAQSAVWSGPLQLGKASDDGAGKALQEADRPQMGQRPVHPVEVLAYILEKENGAGEVRQVRGSDQTLQQGEVSPDERALGDPGAKGHDSALLRNQDVLGRGYPFQYSGRLVRAKDAHEVTAA